MADPSLTLEKGLSVAGERSSLTANVLDLGTNQWWLSAHLFARLRISVILKDTFADSLLFRVPPHHLIDSQQIFCRAPHERVGNRSIRRLREVGHFER